MATDYTAGAQGAGDLDALVAAMNTIDQIAQSEKGTAARMRDAATMWTGATDAVGTLIDAFPRPVSELMSTWRSKTDAPLFKEATDGSMSSLATSRDSMSGGAGGGLSANLLKLAETIDHSASESARIKAEVVKQAQEAQSSLFSGAADLLLESLRPVVVSAGLLLNDQAAAYDSTAQQVLAAGKGLNWSGPGGENGAGSGSAGPSAQSAQSAGGATQGGGGGASSQAGGAPAGAQQADAAQGAGADAGAAGAGAGAGADGGAGAGGATPSDPGGTGLAGLPAPPMPATPLPPGSLPSPAMPQTPGINIPPAGIPYPPLTSPRIPVATKLPAGSKLSLPGAGVIGGAGGGGGGLGGSKLGELGGIKPATALNSTAEQSIAQAAKQVSSPQVGNGQAPTMPAGSGTSPAGGPTTGAGAPPPMMPPGAMAGAGGGRGTKPGTGAIRPTGRERNRPTGPTPGVPNGLRGKSGRAGNGSFPVTTASAKQRRDREQKDGTQVDTLQLLDEELWEVEGAAPAPTMPAPQPQRRLAR